MNAKSSLLIVVCLLMAESLLALEASISADYNYGFQWTSSLFVTISSLNKPEEAAGFVRATLADMLSGNQFSIMSQKTLEGGEAELRVSTTDPRHMASSEWHFFGGRDKYLLAEKKAGCLFLLAAMKHTIKRFLPDVESFRMLDADSAATAREHVEAEIKRLGYLAKYNQRECTVHQEIMARTDRPNGQH